MNELLSIAMLCTSGLMNISSVDDALIDALALGITPSPLVRRRPHVPATPTMGVFIANWQEEDVLDKMVKGNLGRIASSSVRLYLGVYSNDTGTYEVAIALAKQYPDRLRVIVNTLPGPTSKGQMLNEMFRQVYSAPDPPELVILHDSEDVIDPRTFEIYTAYAPEWDFIQVPVFSLSSTDRSIVAATYMDEFAERHTREMIVRNALGAMIPSAGVGTCVTRPLIEHFLRLRGTVLMTDCVTEDYILGVEAKRAGFKVAFAAMSTIQEGRPDYVATREYFPKSLAASIKQKTRWVYGINFEATRKLGWAGDMWDRYFLVRDRKGVVTNFLPALSLFFLTLVLLGIADPATASPEVQHLLFVSFAINTVFLALRYVIRVHASRQVYGCWNPFGVILRWPVALYINMAAVWRAWKTFLGESAFGTRPIAWSKTTHEIPENFMTAK
jgi:adsorption protein B